MKGPIVAMYVPFSLSLRFEYVDIALDYFLPLFQYKFIHVHVATQLRIL